MIKVEIFCDNPSNSNTYLVKTNTGFIVIDPSNSVNTLKKFIQDKPLLAIFLTHGHYDHFKSIEELIITYNPNIYMHKNAYKKLFDSTLSVSLLFNKTKAFKSDINMLFKLNSNLFFVSNDSIINVDNLSFKCMYLPGHTDCSIGFLLDNNLFIGDTLFYESVGRWDLPTGDYLKLKETLKKIRSIKQELLVYPGHDDVFELTDALRHNKYLLQS